MKLKTKWLVIAVVAALLAAAVLRAVSKRNAQQEAVASISNGKAETVVELTANDVVRAQTRDLAQGLPLSGTLKALNSAMVKARVAGELQALTVREGDAVNVGQVLARIDPSEYLARLKQAQEQALAAKAQMDIAQRQYDNNKALVDQGFISRTALATSESSLQSALATHMAARATVEVAQKAVDDTVLRAPIAGIVAQRLAQTGERVAIEARVVEIVDLRRIELEAALGAGEAAGVRVGQSATLSVEGIASPVSAKLLRINPSAQTGTRSVLVYLGLAPVEGLRQGVFAQGQLDTAHVSALSVPLLAVRTDKPEPYVQLVVNQAVVHQSVKLGVQGMAQAETMVTVTGIDANALVIRGSVGPLRVGTRVRLTDAGKLPAPAAVSTKAGG